MGQFAVFGESTKMSVFEINPKSNFDIFPNPTSDYLVIKNTTAFTEPVNIDIYNSLGKLMGSYRLMGINPSLSVKDLIAGNYIIKFYNNSVQYTQSFVKM